MFGMHGSATAKAESVARYFLHLAATVEEPTPMTQMYLHKLMYYAQGWCIGIKGRPLYGAELQAWQHGPVVKSLYPKFADYGSDAISRHEACEPDDLTVEEREHIDWVWAEYGKYSAMQLRHMTHREPPWQKARAGLPESEPSQAPISQQVMAEYFGRLHEESCRKVGISPEVLRRSMEDARAGRTTTLELRTNRRSGS